MTLTDAQRLRALQRHTEVLSAWSSAAEWPLGEWTFTPAGGAPQPLRLGDPWPVVDVQVRGGPAVFESVLEVPAGAAGRALTLELDVQGEGLVTLTPGGTFGLNPYHRAFPVAAQAGRVAVRVEAVPKGLFGAHMPAPRLVRADLVAPEPEVVALVADLRAVHDACQALDGHEAVPFLLNVAAAALNELRWPSATAEHLSRLRAGSVSPGFVAGAWSVPDPLPPAQPLGAETLASVSGARTSLAAGLDRVRALYPPVGRLALSGHAHIDLAWLWPVRETRRKLRRTMHTVLDLMDRFPDFTFNQSSAQAYVWLQEDDPELFARLRARVAEGRFEPVGGMWVEPDAQMPGGESLARQLLYGQRYFQDTFGQRNTVAWLPDTFGFSPALPQLLLQAGIGALFTTKLNWSETTRFPHDLFSWEGQDGSRVLVHTFHNPGGSVDGLGGYNGDVAPTDLLGTWRHFRGKATPAWGHGPPESLLTYGYGDGGGGPTAGMLEAHARLRDFPALPALRHARVDDFFAALPTQGLPVWVGELYLELHRAVLTSQARVKRLNRQAEHRLLEAEAACVRASLRGGAYPAAELEGLWKTLLLNQFHDILPGSGIAEVYEDAGPELTGVVGQACALRDRALGGAEAGGLGVFNAALHDRPLTAMLPPGTPGARLEGRPLPVQAVEDGVLVHAPDVRVPALGRVVLQADAADAPPETNGVSARTEGRGAVLENALLRVEIGPDGSLDRVLDKAYGREVLAGRGNVLTWHHDLPRNWEAWDVAPETDGPGETLDTPAATEITESGPLRAAVRVTRTWRGSSIVQTYRLLAGSRRLDIHTRLDWHERRVLLKAAFPLAVHAREAWFETAYGAQARPTHRNTPFDRARFEVSAHRWADLSESGYGVSLLNDGRYGHSARANVLSLSLVRGPMYPDPQADEGEHEVTYALYPHAGSWAEGGTVAAGLDLGAPLVAVPGASGPWPALVRASGLPLALGSLKRAEDGQGIVLRVYEPHGARGRATLTVPGLMGAGRVTLLEDPVDGLEVRGETITLQVSPFEVLSLRLTLADGGNHLV